MKSSRLLVLGLLLASCGVEIVEYDDFSDLGDDSPCGGTGGLCTIACSTDLDCVEYSDDAVCGEAGVCEARSSCLGAEVCGPEARCSTDWNECRPLGRKPLGATCVHAAECASGACAGTCLEPCYANRDCGAEQHCVVADVYYEGGHGFCQALSACDSCIGSTQVCDPVADACFDTCRTSADCDAGACVAEQYVPFWSCSVDVACPPDAFSFGGACFVHDACDTDDDCDGGICRPLGSNFQGGYCSPQV